MVQRSVHCLITSAIVLVTSCARVGSGRVAADGAPPVTPAGDAAADVPAVPNADAAVERLPAPDAPTACVNLQCKQVACAGPPTSISGTVFAPNGTLPLYNVIVYVPNAPLDPLPVGVSCDRCGAIASGRALVTALSDHLGHFTLKNVPVGKDIPLVIQLGKWRRQVTIPTVTACQDNPVTDHNLTRLPRNRQEGDLPRMAVTTGYCDQIGCLLPKVGIDASELGVAGENKAAAFFKGSGVYGGGEVYGPPNMRPATDLWNVEAELQKYDLAMLSCECTENYATKSAASYAAMTNYIGKGGRIFGSHFAYIWVRNSSDPLLVGALTAGTGSSSASGPLTIDTSFPKGKAMADWMKALDPTITYGEIAAEQLFDNFTDAMRPAVQVWASAQQVRDNVPHPRIFTVNTPVGQPAEKQCGRAAHLDAHISATGLNGPPPVGVFPAVCGQNLTKGEEALAFLFFDLSACIQDDTKPVVPPIVVP